MDCEKQLRIRKYWQNKVTEDKLKESKEMALISNLSNFRGIYTSGHNPKADIWTQ